MHTIAWSGTRSTAIDAAVDVVLDLIGDPRALPWWAPGFAPSVELGSDGSWLVGERRRVRVEVARAQGTVDIVPADRAVPGGAYLRVVPNGDGAELAFTLVAPTIRDGDAAAQQLLVLEEELATVRRLCEEA